MQSRQPSKDKFYLVEVKGSSDDGKVLEMPIIILSSSLP